MILFLEINGYMSESKSSIYVHINPGKSKKNHKDKNKINPRKAVVPRKNRRD
jgi:hypothetical protein